ncbi:MAG: sugar transferase [Ignavibacteria bacterium]|nr:sugar transferase [Ignavibacteria bacterium]
MNSLFSYAPLKRSIDILFSTIGITVFFFPVLLIGIMIRSTSKGHLFHRAYRIGKEEKPFVMFKIRTMIVNTPVKSFESLKEPEKFYVRFGKALRLSGIDELPQLYNILKGEMSLVGPRPTLFDQTDLIDLREENNIYKVKPGLTGYAQINGRTKLTSASKVSLDKYYLDNISLKLDMIILFKTLPAIIKDIRIAKDQKENTISDVKKVFTEVS